MNKNNPAKFLCAGIALFVLFAVLSCSEGLFGSFEDLKELADEANGKGKTYTVTFESNEGSAVASQNVRHGGNVIEPANPVKSGFILAAWYKEEECVNPWDFESDIVTGNITLFAKWGIARTVSFEANGGNPEPSPQIIASDVRLNEPPSMTKTGYIFAGWFKEAGFSNQWNFTNNTVTEDLTLFAKWVSTGSGFSVAFKPNGGMPAPNSPIIVAFSGNVPEPGEMNKTNYSFAGWYTEDTFINKWDFQNKTVSDHITLYARWIPDHLVCTVTFNSMGGSGVLSKTIEIGSLVEKPADPTNGSYSFGGWYREQTFTTPWNFAADIVSVNTTLYAKWGYTVSFNSNSGSAVPSQVIVSGGKAVRPPDPVRDSYKFTGWYSNPGLTVLYDFNTPVTNYIVLNASWKICFSDIQALSYYLGSESGGTSAASPLSVAVSFDLGNMTSPSSNWQNLLGTLNTRGKFVDLDLGDCIINGGATTEFNPVSSISTGKDKIVAIILPDTAKSILEGSYDTQSFKHFTYLVKAAGREVTSIGAYAFYVSLSSTLTSKLMEVDFPAVTSIPNSAFFNCDSLIAVNFPIVTSIADAAFYYCSRMITASFPMATSIGTSGFYKCFSLTTVNFPNLRTIGGSAFESCKLTTVSFPSLTSIGNAAFSGCTSLINFSFPASITLDDNPFIGCTELVFNPTGAGPLGIMEGGKALIRNNTELVAYPAAKGDFTLPSSITSIGKSAFSNCAALTNITLPSAIIGISVNAFEGCTGLTSLTLQHVTSIGDGAFDFCGGLVNVDCPNVTAIGYRSFSRCGKLDNASFPKAEIIGGLAFSQCDSLTSLYIPSVTDIFEKCFADTGSGPLTITMYSKAPTVQTASFEGISSKTVTINVPSGATGYGTSVSGSNATINWANGFRGAGWDGSAFLGGPINTNITVNIVEQP